jgi:hypothetical protein
MISTSSLDHLSFLLFCLFFKRPSQNIQFALKTLNTVENNVRRHFLQSLSGRDGSSPVEKADCQRAQKPHGGPSQH